MQIAGKRGRRNAALLLLLLAAGLGGVIFLETQQQMEPSLAASAQEAPPRPARTHQTEPTFVMPPFATFAEVVARPLFSPTRRPVVGPSTERLANFSVVGIVTSPQERHALLSHGLPPKVDRVAEGQSLDGWTVKSIGDDSIVMVQGDREVELKPTDKASRPQVQPVPRMPPSDFSPIRPRPELVPVPQPGTLRRGQ